METYRLQIGLKLKGSWKKFITYNTRFRLSNRSIILALPYKVDNLTDIIGKYSVSPLLQVNATFHLS